jgi:hypothetical protein
MLLLFGSAFVIFAAASALAVISGALYRAPEGDERGDGLHIRQRNRPRPFLLARSAGSGGFQELRTDESLQICANVNSGFDGILRRYSDEGADESEHHGTSSRHLISHITLALGEATEPDLLAARSAAPDQRHMRHSSVPRQRT